MKLDDKIINELLLAMDTRKSIALTLIQKLISETIQPGIEGIKNGEYYLIENSELVNGKEELSDNWRFDVHGEHCLFINTKTSQELEVYLSNKEGVGNLDPYFFYRFLLTTTEFNHLTLYFKNPFNDMCDLFQKLMENNIMNKYYRKV